MNDLIVVPQTNQWQNLKALVLDSVSSPITKRVYNLGLDEFFAWYGQEARAGFPHRPSWQPITDGENGARVRRRRAPRIPGSGSPVRAPAPRQCLNRCHWPEARLGRPNRSRNHRGW